MLNLGQPAPDFTATTTTGEPFKLSDHRGKIVVLYFFPKAFTPGCTMQTETFRDHYPELKALGVEVVGISADDHRVQCDFGAKLGAQFPMIGDKERRLIDLFDAAWPVFKLAQRVTFVIDREGKLRHFFHHELRISHHVTQVIDAAKRLAQE